MSIDSLLSYNSWTHIKPYIVTTSNLNIVIKDKILSFKPENGLNGQVLALDNNNIKFIDNNNNISSVYCLNNDLNILFNNDINISNIFELFRTGNYILNNLSNQKILLKIHLLYKWDNNISRDYDIDIYINDISIYTQRVGISDYVNIYNKYVDELILDIKKDDILNIVLSVSDGDTTHFNIKKNSFYSIELL